MPTKSTNAAPAVPQGVIFHPASGLDATVAQVQAAARTRILRAFVGRGLIESFDAKEMLGVLAPNSPLRAAVTALAQAVPVRAPQVPAVQSAATAGAPGAAQPPASEPAKRFPAHISPARRPPLWDDCDAQAGKGVDVEPDWDVSGQIAPDYPVDQRIAW